MQDEVRHDGEIHSPAPPSERGAWLTAVALCLLGAGVLAAVLSGAVGFSSKAPAVDLPAVPGRAAAPTAASASEAALRSGSKTVAGPYALQAGTRAGALSGGGSAAGAYSGGTPWGASSGGAPAGASSGGTAPSASSGGSMARVASVGPVVAAPTGGPNGAGGSVLDHTEVHISAAWEAGFYPIYAEAQRVFGVNWLLIASIHSQESAFSTAPSTYHGLNFAGCCGGPMQFNVTNGPVSTWGLVENAYRYGRRPAVYDHPTAHHPSIYDDYDSVMAAAWLLSSDGAAAALDDSAWWAAYDYYGHDAAGVEYADEVLARAIGWSQHGFCINCGVEPALVNAVHEAYGAPVAATYTTATIARVGPKTAR